MWLRIYTKWHFLDLHNQWRLSAVPRVLMQRHPYCFCCWRIAAGDIIHLSLIKNVFSPLWSHCYWSGWYTLWPVLPESQTEIRGRSNAPPPPPQLQISVFMQSNRVVDGKDDCEMAGQRVQQWRRVPLFNMWQALMHLALKGNVRRRLDWFELRSTQNTPMTLNYVL